MTTPAPPPSLAQQLKNEAVKKLERLGTLLSETLKEWNDDKAPRLAAALAFYSVLSIGPLLLIVTGIAGVAFGREAVNGYLLNELSTLIGTQGAMAVQTMLTGAFNPHQGLMATLIGVITLVISATGFFAQLQDAMNTIWNVDETGRHWSWFIQKRLLSFALVLGIGFLLLVSLVVSAALTAFGEVISPFLPTPAMVFLNFS